MVVLVLCAVEGDRVGGTNGHCERWLTSGLARRTLQESRVERTIGLAGSAAAAASRGDGVVLGSSATINQVIEGLTHSCNPNELDRVTNGSGNGRGRENPLAARAHLDLVGGSVGGRNAKRSSNDGIDEMHG